MASNRDMLLNRSCDSTIGKYQKGRWYNWYITSIPWPSSAHAFRQTSLSDLFLPVH